MIDLMESLVQHQISPLTGEPCCSRAPKRQRVHGEFTSILSQYKAPPTPPKREIVVRTGCIPCLAKRVRCDGSDPQCRKASITDVWRVNRDLARPPYGTWRERKGLHAFVHFALAPERVGLFESNFWHRTVMQACFNSEAIFHVASAIGALQERIFRRPPAGRNGDANASAFALYQCNRAIKLLIASSKDSERPHNDPGIPLVAAVLFAIFEALHGDSEQAMNQALQARHLLRYCERIATTNRRSRLVDPMTIRPVIGTLEIQAVALQGRDTPIPEADEEPLVPDIERIYSLEHANRTLHFAYVSLLAFCQTVSLAASQTEIKARMMVKNRIFATWFRKWGLRFAEFLFNEAPSLTSADMRRAKVLKANYLVASMLSNIDQGGSKQDWEKHNNDCKAIIDLAASVLHTHSVDSSAPLSSFHFPHLSFGFWVTEPLFIVMSRSYDPELRREAASLLSRQPRADYAQHILVRENGGTVFAAAAGRKDTDDWDMERWIEFARETRLDTAMATYFGRLPSAHIAKPFYRLEDA